jgi:hypothetical protein
MIMKKKGLLVAFSLGLITSVGFTQQAEVISSKDAFKSMVKNGLDKEAPINPKNTGVFIPEWRESHLYNTNDEEFNLSSRNVYSYVNSNELAEDLTENYNAVDEAFEPSFKGVFSKAGNWSVSVYENYDAVEEEWYVSSIDSTEVNAFGDEIYYAFWYYDNMLDEMVLSNRSTYDITYNANGDIETIVYSSTDSNGDLQLIERENYIYDGSGVIIEATFEDWDDLDEEWEFSFRGVNIVWHDQDAFLVASADLEEWNGSDWELGSRITISYYSDNSIGSELEEEWDEAEEEFINSYFYERLIDANMVETSTISYNWDEVEDEWEINWGNTYVNTYNSDDELEEQIMSYWNSWDEEWVILLKYIYSYIDIASIDEIKTHTVAVFPNPTSERVTIQSESNLNNVIIVGMNGQVHYSSGNISAFGHEIDVQFLNAGTYFILSQDENGVAKSKLIIQ